MYTSFPHSRPPLCDLARREEKADKTKFAERIERVRLKRQQVAPKPTLPATSDTQYFLIAAE